jgi:ribosomal protein S6--L-glutamate ligase
MRIAFLSGGDGWHVRDLKRAAEQLGHVAETIDFRRLWAAVADGDEPLRGFDAVIVRTMPPGSLEQVVFRMDLLHLLVSRGVRVVNGPRALEVCIDKYLATAKLDMAQIPVPATVVCQTSDDALGAFARLGEDVVVKPLFGSEGRGMVRVTDTEVAWRTFRVIEQTRGVIYLQKFVHHPGFDTRVFVLGGRVLAGMRRHARDGWRTNVAQGGRAEPVRVADSQHDLALRAADAVGAVACGVDIISDSHGRDMVLEVNAVPGWRALAPTCGVDVARAMIEHVVRA